MANLCTTLYYLVGSKDDVKRLYDDFSAVKETPFGYSCYDVAECVLHLSEEETKKMRLRGDVVDIQLEDEELIVHTSTAWLPCTELFDLLAEKYNLESYWMADERGCVGVWSNDVDGVFFDAKYVICHHPSGEEEDFDDEANALERCENVSGETFETFDEICEHDDFRVTEIEYNDNF